MNFRDWIIILSVMAFIIVSVVSATTGDEMAIILTLALFLIAILMIISNFLEKKFPKSKISNKIENIAEWIRDNIRF